jgi:peroxiredoxin
MVFFLLLFVPANVHAFGNPLKPGDPFPDFQLPVPQDKAQQKYLGVSGKGTFRIQDIQAEVVIIQIFHSGWAICQREAPGVNKLYRILTRNKKLKEKIKLIGIGAKDDIYAIKFVKESWHVKFPIFTDEDREIHEKFGEPGTPYFFCVKIKKKGGVEIFYTHPGKLSAVDEFINTIVEKAGLDK